MSSVKKVPDETGVAHADPPRPLAPPREVARYYGLPEKTLAAWRSQGKGPPYRKYGRHVRYAWSDVIAWREN